MKFHRRAPQPTSRQKLPTDDLAPAQSSFSYRARRSEMERNLGRQAQRDGPAPVSNRAAHFWLQRFGLIILLVAVVASLTNVLSLSNTVRVVPLTDGANRSLLRPTKIYQEEIAQELSHSIWNDNKITFDSGSLSRYLLTQFPELSSVSVTVPLLAHRPVVYIEPAQPVLILIAGNGSFVVDSSGRTLSTAINPAALDEPTLPVVDDQNRFDVPINGQALSADNVSFIQTVVGQLAAKQFTVSTMSLAAGASELDVHLNGQPYFVKFNLESSNPRGEAGTFLATISQLHRQNITPTQYVDVRVDGRAYYK